MLQHKHLLGLEGYPSEDIQTIIDTAFGFRKVLERPIKKVPSLQGKTVVNLFFEMSTRTRISFELAQKRMSADTVSFSAASSSLNKGESFKDTVQNIEAMKIDATSRFLWRFPPRRLEAEGIRDSMLSVSGVLDLKMGGPGFSGFEVEKENVRLKKLGADLSLDNQILKEASSGNF